MSTDQGRPSDTAVGGQGRLAQVIATRGGQASPEAPFVIEHREALIYMLCEAAELEHGIMCQYLFAAFSLKQDSEEGLSGPELDTVRRWRMQVSHVATQEMLHLALVHNLLSAIGGPPHLVRPNLPAPASHYPAGVQLALLPFGEEALQHFMFLERPEGMDLQDADGLAAVGRAAPVLNRRDIVPRGQDFATVGHLYRSIEAGLQHLSAKNGEDWLFVGPPRAQATREYFGWPELVPVTDLASARRAIEEILEQGEGPRGNWRDAHFGQFVRILDEYQQLCAANEDFDPVRPVLGANVRRPERDVQVPLIGDPLTARVTDLFNVGYEILLQIFERFFAHTDETDSQLKALADATIGLMLRVIKPLGDLITRLPVGPAYPARTAGPSFELFYESDYLLPHREAAWALMSERLDQAARLCGELPTGRGKHLASQLAPVQAAMRDIARSLAAHLPAGSPHARLAAPVPTLQPSDLDALLQRAADFAGIVGPAPDTAGLSDLVGVVHALVQHAAAGRGCDDREQAMIVPRLVESVLRPLADALRTPSAGPGSDQGQVESTGDGGPATLSRSYSRAMSERVWDAATQATMARARLGAADACPPELAEAAAALQDLACSLVPASQAGGRLDRLWHLQSGLPAAVQAAHNGPYLVTNVPRLVDHVGVVQRPAPQLALCRCGNSAIKPLCDGSHASIGFTDAKDPKRVPDRRHEYEGEQITILDNRGICQHSGLCTDRLATVFRSGADPFVAPSGGRMDEIIRAVRDCPSGALSYGMDGKEARSQADWGGNRPATIEVTKDGPYRISGGIALMSADGTAEPRARGASLEHYALCRCGHSQNKPFCSGMHWYVGFRDPVSPDGRDQTLFEYAGGLAALTRMTRFLYEKHVPADPVVAPAFADMPPDQPYRLAGWLAGALGGPSAGMNGRDLAQAGFALPGHEFGEEQRARWVALLTAAAEEAGLPPDSAFRSVFAACVDWASRTAVGQSQPDAVTETGPAPVWDWGPAGPPAAGTATEDAEAEAPQAQLPAAGQPVSYATHIKPLFRERDRRSMSFAFDLSSYADVSARAGEILQRLRDGSMPCDGAWPEAKVDAFRRWTEGGKQP